MISKACLCTREDVTRALDVKPTARMDAQVDRAIEAAVDAVEGLTHRSFFPTTDTRYFDWPSDQPAPSWRLWLNQHELISVTSLVAGGVTIGSGDYFLEPNGSGPPYNRIDIDLSSSSALSSDSTHQQAIAITGVYGHSASTAAAGALAEALDTSETGVDVTDSTLIGVGDTILIGSERMLVTGKTMADTGVNIDAGDSLTASTADVTITMSTTTSAPVIDEVILIGSERMLVTDVAGTALTVKRAWDGTVLATHAASADIYAPRTLTVVRGALGTTAASHDNATAVNRHVVPALIRQLAIAEAIVWLQQEGAGYARTAGSGDNVREVSGRGVKDVRDQAYTTYGRKARRRVI